MFDQKKLEVTIWLWTWKDRGPQHVYCLPVHSHQLGHLRSKRLESAQNFTSRAESCLRPGEPSRKLFLEQRAPRGSHQEVISFVVAKSISCFPWFYAYIKRWRSQIAKVVVMCTTSQKRKFCKSFVKNCVIWRGKATNVITAVFSTKLRD